MENLYLFLVLNIFYTSLIDECDHIFAYWDSKNSREFDNVAISPYMLVIISLLQQKYLLNYVCIERNNGSVESNHHPLRYIYHVENGALGRYNIVRKKTKDIAKNIEF